MSHWHHYLGMAAGVGLVAAVISTTSEKPALAQTIEGVEGQVFDPRELSCGNQPCDAVVRGALAFLRRNFEELGSNGRACADCHMPSENFQLSPAAAGARFERLMARRVRNPNADDPLFRPVDADDFRVNGDAASDFSNLVENGLVRVTMPLPLNVRLIDPATGQPSDETSVDLWRAVIPVLNVAITGPDSRCRSGRRALPAFPSWAKTRTAPTGRGATSTTRASPPCRNRRVARSSRTRR